MSFPLKRQVFRARREIIYPALPQGKWSKILVRALIILAVAAVSLFAGWIAGTEYWLLGVLALAGIVAVAGAFFLSEHLHWSLLILLVLAAYVPLYLPTGTSSIIVDSLLATTGLVALWLLRMLVVEKRFHLYPSPANLPAFGYMAATLISLVWSTVFRDAAVRIWDTFPLVQIASTLVMIMLPCAFLLVGNQTTSENMLKLAIGLFLTTGLVVILEGIVGFDFVNHDGLFNMWIMAFAVSMAYFHGKMHALIRLALLGLAGVYVYYAFVVGISWVSGWLPGLATIGLLTLSRSRKLLAVVILIGLIVLAWKSSYFLDKLDAEKSESGGTRIAAWRMNWRVTGQHFLFGTGPGGYAAYYMTYYPNQGMATHNNYIDVVAQTGVVGLAFWLWFFGAVFWSGFRLIRRVRGRGDFMEGLANALFAGAAGCILIMMFGDWLLPFAYTQTIAGYDYAVYSWMFLGLIVAMHRILDQQALERAHA